MVRFARDFGAAALLCAFWCASAASQGWQHVGAVQSAEKLDSNGVELTAGAVKVRITEVSDGVVRVRVAPDGKFGKDFSWAVVAAAEDREKPAVQLEEGKTEIKITAGRVIVLVNKNPLLIRFADAAGNVQLADEPDLPMAWNGLRVHVWKKMPLEENYFGLGDKAGPMNRRNRSFTMWNMDMFGWQESTDPLYKDIPFFIGLRKGAAYGVFFDNTYRSSFDFGKESADYFSFGADGGELNYYFIAGPEPDRK